MLKVSVDLKQFEKIIKNLEKLNSAIDDKVARDVGKYAVSEMKSMIEVGLSPIQGKGRFPAYKIPTRYPGVRKPPRPVNLKLSGQFLDSLSFRLTPTRDGTTGTTVYYNNQEANDKEDGHREGTNGQPKRPTIPIEGEEFAQTLQLGIAEIYKNALVSYLNGLK